MGKKKGAINVFFFFFGIELIIFDDWNGLNEAGERRSGRIGAIGGVGIGVGVEGRGVRVEERREGQRRRVAAEGGGCGCHGRHVAAGVGQVHGTA